MSLPPVQAPDSVGLGPLASTVFDGGDCFLTNEKGEVSFDAHSQPPRHSDVKYSGVRGVAASAQSLLDLQFQAVLSQAHVEITAQPVPDPPLVPPPAPQQPQQPPQPAPQQWQQYQQWQQFQQFQQCQQLQQQGRPQPPLELQRQALLHQAVPLPGQRASGPLPGPQVPVPLPGFQHQPSYQQPFCQPYSHAQQSQAQLGALHMPGSYFAAGASAHVIAREVALRQTVQTLAQEPSRRVQQPQPEHPHQPATLPPQPSAPPQTARLVQPPTVPMTPPPVAERPATAQPPLVQPPSLVQPLVQPPVVGQLPQVREQPQQTGFERPQPWPQQPPPVPPQPVQPHRVNPRPEQPQPPRQPQAPLVLKAWYVTDEETGQWGQSVPLEVESFGKTRSCWGREGTVTMESTGTCPEARWSPCAGSSECSVAIPFEKDLVEFPLEEPTMIWVKVQLPDAEWGHYQYLVEIVLEHAEARQAAAEYYNRLMHPPGAAAVPQSSGAVLPPVEPCARPAISPTAACAAITGVEQVEGPDGVVRLSRSVEEIRAEFDRVQPNGHTSLSSLPHLVPGTTMDALLAGVNRQVCGNFHVTRYNKMASSGLKYVQRIRCSCHTEATKAGRGTGCQWWVAYELTSQGWILARGSDAAIGACDRLPDHVHPADKDGYGRHNHPFYSTDAESAANAVGHNIGDYPAFVHMGTLLAKGGESTATIDRILTLHWKELHGKYSVGPWNYKTLFSRFKASGNKLDLDFSGLMDQLGRQREEDGLAFFHDYAPATNRVNRLFVELRGGKEDWARGGKDNVLLFDPTHGTNVYRWKLCLFTSVCDRGCTIIVAWSVLETEGINDFEWAFRCFADVFRIPPSVIFTDHDPNLEEAIRRMRDASWPATSHHLCIYHLSKNFYERLRGRFLCDKGGDKWKKVHDLFWRICKSSDVSCRETFGTRWQGLVQLVQDSASNRDGLQEQLDWLQALGELKDRFVYCFTWRICTLTLASTQRAEVMQNVAKNTMGMGTKTTLTEMFNKADVYNHDSRHKHDVKAVRTASSQARTAAASLPPLLQDLQPLVSVFAYKLLSSQAQQASKYRYESGEEEGVFNVYATSRGDTHPTCEQGDACRGEESHACAFDNGEGDHDITGGRKVSVAFSGVGAAKTLVSAKCSCQFGISSGTGLCRHILAVAVSQQAQRIEIKNFCIPKLLAHDKQDIALALHRLSRTSVARSRVSVGHGDTDADATPTLPTDTQARRIKLQALAHSCVDIAKQDQDLFERMTTGLEALVDTCARLLATRRPSRTSTTQQSLPTRSCATGPSLRSTSTPLEDVPLSIAGNRGFVGLSAASQKAVLSALRNDWLVAPWQTFGPDPEEILGFSGLYAQRMVGRHILCKWSVRRQGDAGGTSGEWFIGRVICALKDPNDQLRLAGGIDRPKNFRVHYDDDDVRDQALSVEVCLNYEEKASPVATWWMLLEPKPLHAEPFGGVQPPHTPRALGRPPSGKRKQPVSGPTNANYKRRKSTTPSKGQSSKSPARSPGKSPGKGGRG